MKLQRTSRWLARAAFAGVAVGLALGCGAILGIDDVAYGPPAEGGDGSTSGEGAIDRDGDVTCSGPKPTNCGNVCVDLTSDGRNCGRCGRDCGGPGSCASSRCTEVVIQGGLDGPHGIAVDNGFVYFTMLGERGFDDFRRPGSIARISVGGGAIEYLQTGQAEPSFLLVRDGRMVWTTRDGLSASLTDGGSLTAITDAGRMFGLTEVDGGVCAISPYGAPNALVRWTPGAPSLSLAATTPSGRILIEDRNTLYWTVVNKGVAALPLDGLPAVSVSPVGNQSVSSWGIAQTDAFFYYTTTNSVRRVAKVGGVDSEVSADLAGPRTLVVDGDAIYVTEFEGQRVARIPLDGGAPGTALAIERIGVGAGPTGIALAGDFLYWTSPGNVGGLVAADDDREPLHNGSIRRIRIR